MTWFCGVGVCAPPTIPLIAWIVLPAVGVAGAASFCCVCGIWFWVAVVGVTGVVVAVAMGQPTYDCRDCTPGRGMPAAYGPEVDIKPAMFAVLGLSIPEMPADRRPARLVQSSVLLLSAAVARSFAFAPRSDAFFACAAAIAHAGRLCTPPIEFTAPAISPPSAEATAPHPPVPWIASLILPQIL